MALEPGSRLGHYNVTSLLGEGGMGQVWQATDILRTLGARHERRTADDDPGLRPDYAATACRPPGLHSSAPIWRAWEENQ